MQHASELSPRDHLPVLILNKAFEKQQLYSRVALVPG